MDWMEEALSYPECNITRVRDFAPEAEMKLAIAQYNRAVRNLRSDSMDIAIIALRKLASSYPTFAQAALLYGVCQMAAGNLRAGLEAFTRADADNYTERYRTRAEEYRESAKAQFSELPTDSGTPPISEEEYHIRPTAPLLQRGVTSRRRIRILSDRGGSRSGDNGKRTDDKPSHSIREPLSMRYPFLQDYRKIVAAAAAVLLVGVAVFGLVKLGSWLVGSIKPAPPSAEKKLSWLLDRLESEADSGTAGAERWTALLAEYRSRYETSGTTATPGDTTAQTTVPQATTAPTPSTVATSSTAAPTPTATPVPPTAPNHTATINTAFDLLTDAKGRLTSQPIEALRLLNVLGDVLTDVPADAAAPGIDSNAGQLLTEKDALIANNWWFLCESHRVAAEAPWQRRDYAACLPLYEAIYQIDPEYYTGYCAFRLGLCYEQIGAVAKAMECYRTVEEIGPASPQYTGALARIQALG